MLLLTLSAVLFACAGIVSAVAATFTAGLLAIGADALALDFLASVTTPWARVLRLTTDFAAVAGLLRPPAYAAAATRVVNLRSSTVYAASAISMLI